ncbi:hypothetical protein [Streptomyces exfoliatus]|uniref:hypothetical protein n=1 Tax=Streptomyces exfoliatus TaxID=1905 RepID=UPI000463C21C|nr:hypothetical protein [Streptomyces exfoliatus]
MKMNDTYRDAIAETLKSVTTHEGFTDLTVGNVCPFPLSMYLVSDEAWWIGGVEDAFLEPGYPALTVPAATTLDFVSLQGFDLGWYLIFLNAHSGGFVAVRQLSTAVSNPSTGQRILAVDRTQLLDANDIGPVPQPNESVVIPPDSPRIVVGFGQTPNGNVLTREQYWQRLPDSYSIAAGATRTVEYTVTSGMESTTSTQTDLGSTVMADGNAGWGPISASLSTSLSAGSTSFQQVSTNVETSSFVSQLYDNEKGQKSRICFYWQLTNLLTVFENDHVPVSSLIYGSGPAVISAHDLDDLPPRPLKKDRPMSEEMRAQLSGPSKTALATDGAA